MPHIKDYAIGVIVFSKDENSLLFLLLKHKKGHWSFAKGHSEKGETPLQTAVRELHEEAGIFDIQFVSENPVLFENYVFKNKKMRKVKKKVEYFIAETHSKKVIVDNHEITDYKWCTLDESSEVLSYSQSHETLKKAEEIILNKTVNRNEI